MYGIFTYMKTIKINHSCRYIWVFPKIGVPQNGWFIMENPIKMGWFGGKTHYFRKHPYTSPHGNGMGYFKKTYFCLACGSLWLRYQDLPEPGPPTEPLTQLGTPLPGSQVKKAAEEAKEAKAQQIGGVFFRGSSSLSLRILAHRTSDDERLGCFPSSPKRKVFRFHETILKRWDWIPRVCWWKLSEDSVNSERRSDFWWTSNLRHQQNSGVVGGSSLLVSA